MPYVEKLRMIKEEKDLTNAEIAKVGNVPLATVTRVFNEKTPTQNPTFETIVGIAIGLGVSLDELIGLKQPDAPPVPSPIENTLQSYSELLQEKDNKIKELQEDKRIIRREKYTIIAILAALVVIVLALLAVDILNGDIGKFRY